MCVCACNGGKEGGVLHRVTWMRIPIALATTNQYIDWKERSLSVAKHTHERRRSQSVVDGRRFLHPKAISKEGFLGENNRQANERKKILQHNE